MPEYGGALGGLSSPSEDALSGDALYKRAMAHYRRREWRQAREGFLRLKAADPGRRGIDAVLDELNIFIRLDSFDPAPTLPAAHHLPWPAPLWAKAGPGAAAWRVLAGAGVVALVAVFVLLAYRLAGAQAARRVQELHGVALARSAAHDWSAAIDAYEEWLLLTPADGEARSGLWAAYYERGDQRAAEARALEEQGKYAEAAERWEGALADLKAAQQVDPGHVPDPRDTILARISAVTSARRCAALVGQALALRVDRRWAEAIWALQTVQAEDPDYCRARVQSYLGATLLDSGLDALAAARTPAEIGDAVLAIGRAAELQPGTARAQMAVRQAQGYLQGALAVDGRRWDAAVLALEPLLQDAADLTGGHARELLCQAQEQRADERYRAGRLSDALADYQAVAARCSQALQAGRRVAELTRALTPTAVPTPMPTLTPLPTPRSAATTVP